jgi:hypothetical protein
MCTKYAPIRLLKKEKLMICLTTMRLRGFLDSRFTNFLSGRVFMGEEAMLVYLHFIRTGTPFTRMSQFTFGGDPRMFTLYVRAITDHLYSNFYHKMNGDSMRQWAPLVPDFCRAIHNKLMDGIVHKRTANGSQTDYEVWLPLETFRVFGWLDDTDMRTTCS